MAPDTAVILAALPVVPLHTVVGSVIVPGVAGLGFILTTIADLVPSHSPVATLVFFFLDSFLLLSVLLQL